MELDSVELVLEVEDAFGFSIPDEDAAGLTTVGKLYDYVLAHRFRGKQDACLSSMTFYKLRRGLMSGPSSSEEFGAGLDGIVGDHPETPTPNVASHRRSDGLSPPFSPPPAVGS